MLEAAVQGFLTGLFLSTFIGPIFFQVVNLGINSTLRAVAYMALGTFFSDILTVLLIYLVAAQLATRAINLDYLYIAGGLILVTIGLAGFFKTPKKEQQENLTHRSLMKIFMRGFLINSTNPNVFFFWFGAVMVAVKSYNNNAAFVLLHFSTALFVVLSTDFLKGYAASLLKPYITDKVMLWLSRFSGIVLIYFGLKLMFFH